MVAGEVRLLATAARGQGEDLATQPAFDDL